MDFWSLWTQITSMSESCQVKKKVLHESCLSYLTNEQLSTGMFVEAYTLYRTRGSSRFTTESSVWRQTHSCCTNIIFLSWFLLPPCCSELWPFFIVIMVSMTSPAPTSCWYSLWLPLFCLVEFFFLFVNECPWNVLYKNVLLWGSFQTLYLWPPPPRAPTYAPISFS